MDKLRLLCGRFALGIWVAIIFGCSKPDAKPIGQPVQALPSPATSAIAKFEGKFSSPDELIDAPLRDFMRPKALPDHKVEGRLPGCTFLVPQGFLGEYGTEFRDEVNLPWKRSKRYWVAHLTDVRVELVIFPNIRLKEYIKGTMDLHMLYDTKDAHRITKPLPGYVIEIASSQFHQHKLLLDAGPDTYSFSVIHWNKPLSPKSAWVNEVAMHNILYSLQVELDQKP